MADTPVTEGAVERRRDNFRSIITIMLLSIFAIEVVSSLALPFFFKVTPTGELPVGVVNLVKDSLTLVFGPTVALVGSATGFYFGTRSDREIQAPVIEAVQAAASEAASARAEATSARAAQAAAASDAAAAVARSAARQPTPAQAAAASDAGAATAQAADHPPPPPPP